MNTNTVKIKICGLQRQADINYVNRLRPDFAGFILWNKSRRYVTDAFLSQVKQQLHPSIQSVGVFVNASLDVVERYCTEHLIEVVQLHGEEDEHYIHALKSRVPNPIIKAVRVKNTEEILSADLLPCDYLLLDTYVETEVGGSGKTFDHRIIPPLQKPFFLAGGLHGSIYIMGMQTAHPYGIDASSCLETNGYKDYEKMKAFIHAVRKSSL